MDEKETRSDATAVTVSRMTVASAVDLLTDVENELEQADATGPYLNEVSETIEELENSLQED